mmetsp:Transcript_5062/g.12474  ORF Transcript_5062/g.12474 Transcript_5062/m.12474 type:complete len:285 (-) Transcript_5062:68-922(-)
MSGDVVVLRARLAEILEQNPAAHGEGVQLGQLKRLYKEQYHESLEEEDYGFDRFQALVEGLLNGYAVVTGKGDGSKPALVRLVHANLGRAKLGLGAPLDWFELRYAILVLVDAYGDPEGLLGSKLKPLLRLYFDPQFTEAQYGFKKMKHLLREVMTGCADLTPEEHDLRIKISWNAGSMPFILPNDGAQCTGTVSVEQSLLSKVTALTLECQKLKLENERLTKENAALRSQGGGKETPPRSPVVRAAQSSPGPSPSDSSPAPGFAWLGHWQPRRPEGDAQNDSP